MTDDERFSRLRLLVGQAGLDRLAAACVTVCGLGAVGSFAVEALARAGVGRLRLVDFDQVRANNLNRQLYALEATLGQFKADLAAERVRQITPACQVEALKIFVHTDTLEQVLTPRPDLLIDAIDSVGPKAALLAGAAGLTRVISCMGAATRKEIEPIRLAGLNQTHNCPLARQIRKRLKNLPSAREILCVYSEETPPGDLDPENEIGISSPEKDFHVRGRLRRPLGSLPTITGIFGLRAAHAALEIILRYPPSK